MSRARPRRVLGCLAGAILSLSFLPAAALAQTAGPYTTNRVYDAGRRLILEIQPADGLTAGGARPAKRYTYDADDRLISTEIGRVSAANGSDFIAQQKVAVTYDAVGNKVREVAFDGASSTALRVTQTRYDPLNRPVCSAVRMKPSAFGALPADACVLSTSGADDPDRITKTEYDLAGQALKTVRALGLPIQQDYATNTYSPNGQLVTVKDARNNLTTMEYDGLGRLIKMRLPLPAVAANASSTEDFEAYGYDASGNRTSVRKRDGTTILYEYDAVNRQILKDLLGTADDVRSRYDLTDRPLAHWFETVSPGTSQVSFTYDKAGRQTSETAYGRVMAYQYDKADNRTRVTWPDAFYVSYAYDALNRVTTIGENGVVTGDSRLAQYAYDNRGRLASLTRGNGTVTAYSYDTLDQVQSLSHDVVDTPSATDVKYGFANYNPAGQIGRRTTAPGLSASPATTLYDWVPTAQKQIKAYDGLNRDAALATLVGGYDAKGNLTSDGVRTFTYDAENRLLTVAGPASLALAYDPLGRLRQTVSATVTTGFGYEDTKLSAEYGATGNTPLRRYVHGSGVDNPIVWYEGANRQYLHQDWQGSVIATSDGSTGATKGQIQQIYSYGPYGEPAASGLAGGWAGSRFRYTGQTALPEAQLYYYKARVYDPEVGRFLQTDPIGYGAGLNWYAYVSNDPMNRKDPTGNADIAAACMGAAICNKTIVQTVYIVHQSGGKTVVESTLSVTTNFSVATSSNGTVSVSATSAVSNVSGRKYSSTQLGVMGGILGKMQQSAVGRGFGANTTQMVTAIGVAETRLGVASPSPGSPAFKAPSINPMQLSGGRANMDIDHNINGAMDVLRWAGKPSGFDPRSTYARFSDGSVPTMANWDAIYNGLNEQGP